MRSVSGLGHQVAPFDLAREMRELGFPQEECMCRWVNLGNGPSAWTVAELRLRHNFDNVICAAPTVAEMGEWLPIGFDSGSDEVAPEMVDGMRKRAHKWHAYSERMHGDIDPRKPHVIDATTEAEARARLLIALAESGALDPKALPSAAA